MHSLVATCWSDSANDGSGAILLKVVVLSSSSPSLCCFVGGFAVRLSGDDEAFSKDLHLIRKGSLVIRFVLPVRRQSSADQDSGTSM